MRVAPRPSSAVRQRRARRAFDVLEPNAPHRARRGREKRAVAGIVEPLCARRGDVEIADENGLFELGRARQQLAARTADERVAVENQFVLPADEVAEDDKSNEVGGALTEHPLAVAALAAVIRRRREVDDHVGAGSCLLDVRSVSDPDVLAHRHADRGLAELDEQRAVARAEVAALVEHTVVREMHLVVTRVHATAGRDDRRVVDVVGERGNADESDQPIGQRADKLVQRRLGVAQEVRS
jgi:hypothetical protein